MLRRTREAANYLNVAASTLEAWRCRGGGPEFILLSGRAVRYSDEALDAFISARVRKNTSDTGRAEK
jgi:hypothetical protein